MKKIVTVIGLCSLLFLQFNCSSSSDDGKSDPTTPVDPGSGTNDVDFYLTTGDQTAQLAKQSTVLSFTTAVNSYNNIEVSEGTTYQTVDGFGYTLTGGSVQTINNLTAARKQELLQDLFNASTGIGINYLRLSIGASDLNSTPFTYDDMPAGETDVNLDNFSISQDNALVSLLKEILVINPNIKLIATPWSAPVWMKNNNNANKFVGGTLKPEYYATYAQYFVKYVKAMEAQGISITAVTPQNEPLNPYNNPSLVMQANEQANFIKNNLGPAFETAGITTKIIVYDHNCDVTTYATSIFADAAANKYVDGSAWHLYAGDISALSGVHNAYPTKNIYFTEQYTSSGSTFPIDLKWHVKNVLIGSMRNWSVNAMEWNLAADGGNGPYTDGGCTICKGAITINSSDAYTKNVAYYILAHASKFVPRGSVRIASTEAGGLSSVAFKTPEGKHVLVVENDNTFALTFNIKYNDKWVVTKLDGGSVGTYTW